MFAKASLLATVAAAVTLSASAAQNTPPYQGRLLLQAGSNAQKCLRADNTDGAPVVLASCTGGDDQEWEWKNGAVTLHNGSKCLAVVNNQNSNGAKLKVANCGGDSQQFEYTPWGENHLKWSKGSNKCVDLPSGNMNDGTQVQLYDCDWFNPNQNWNTGYRYVKQPKTSEVGQSGHNDCGTASSQDSSCQTLWLNDVDDFCLWAPPQPNGEIGQTEREEVAWCTKSGYGTRVIPDNTLSGVHFVQTKDYVQVTGVGDLTKINVKKGDYGGELDPHGADGNGNPIGGLVYGNSFGSQLQYHEWTSFVSEKQFCFRACVGPNARQNCQHIYDEMGCFWNMPANYDEGKFESCKADDSLPMGVYGSSTWHQGVSPTPPPHPVPSSSECRTLPTVKATKAKRDLSLERLVKRAALPMMTPAPI